MYIHTHKHKQCFFNPRLTFRPSSPDTATKATTEMADLVSYKPVNDENQEDNAVLIQDGGVAEKRGRRWGMWRWGGWRRVESEEEEEGEGKRGRGRGRGKRKKEPSLVFTLAKTFGSAYLLAAVFKLAQDLLGFVGPQVLR